MSGSLFPLPGWILVPLFLAAGGVVAQDLGVPDVGADPELIPAIGDLSPVPSTEEPLLLEPLPPLPDLEGDPLVDGALLEEPSVAVEAPVGGTAPPAEPAVDLSTMEAPPKMIVDTMHLLGADERWALEEQLVEFRDTRDIHLFCLALPALEGDPIEAAALAGERWAPDAFVRGVILYTPTMAQPVAVHGGRLRELVDPAAFNELVSEAMQRGSAHPTAANSFQATCLEVLEEYEILLNSYEYTLETQPGYSEGGGSGGRPEAARAKPGLLGSVERYVARMGGKRMLLKKAAPYLIGGLLGLLLLGLLLRALWLRARASRSRPERDKGWERDGNEPGGVEEQLPGATPYAALPVEPAAVPRPSRPAQTPVDPIPQSARPPATPRLPANPQLQAEPGPPADPQVGLPPSKRGPRLFPEVGQQYRLLSPYGGGNDVEVALYGAETLTSPEAEPPKPHVATLTPAPAPRAPNPTPIKDDEDDSSFIY